MIVREYIRAGDLRKDTQAYAPILFIRASSLFHLLVWKKTN